MDRFFEVMESNVDKFEEESENGDNIEIDSKEMKVIRDFIEKKMNTSQKMQIIDIIKSSVSKYTLNKNGYFVNMNNIPKETLFKIKIFVDFTRENAKKLQKTEEILNEEKSRIESFDKLDDETNNFSSMLDVDNEKSINFEIYSLDSVQSEVFDEYRISNEEEEEFMGREFLSEKRENSGYKIVLKKYKRKYVGYPAKVLKKFRDISRASLSSRSTKITLNQGKTNVKVKQKKVVAKKVVDEPNNLEEEFSSEEEFSDDEEEELFDE